MKKLHVAILFGGRSGEHEVSLRSARSLFEAIDRDRHQVSLIGIDRSGRWHLLDESTFQRLTDTPLAALTETAATVTLLPEPNQGQLLAQAQHPIPTERIDVVFPILHGTFGEDGTIQGFLELADIPYVGAGVLGSAIGMDKDVQKRLLAAAGIPVVPFTVTSSFEWSQQRNAARSRAVGLGFPLFVKPANLGSSVGITKVTAADQLDTAIDTALAYDTKVVIEHGLDAREIECAVLGNEDPIVSVPGEVCPNAEFYSYEAKYIDDDGAALLIPAPLEPQQVTAIQALARRVFLVLEGGGMARVDFFLARDSGQVYVNEVNTIPGFTSISMYPKLWEASGIPYRDLISRLIDLACSRHAQRQALNRSYLPRDTKPAAARKPSR